MCLATFSAGYEKTNAQQVIDVVYEVYHFLLTLRKLIDCLKFQTTVVVIRQQIPSPLFHGSEGSASNYCAISVISIVYPLQQC